MRSHVRALALGLLVVPALASASWPNVRAERLPGPSGLGSGCQKNSHWLGRPTFGFTLASPRAEFSETQLSLRISYSYLRCVQVTKGRMDISAADVTARYSYGVPGERRKVTEWHADPELLLVSADHRILAQMRLERDESNVFLYLRTPLDQVFDPAEIARLRAGEKLRLNLYLHFRSEAKYAVDPREVKSLGLATKANYLLAMDVQSETGGRFLVTPANLK